MSAAFQAMALAQNAPVDLNLDRFFACVDRLVDVMNKETDLVRSRKIKEAAPLQTEKSKLSNDYIRMQVQLRNHAEQLIGGDATVRDQLKAKLAELRDVSAQNMKVLKAASDAGERVLKAIRSGLQSKRSETGGYTRQGGYFANTADAMAKPAILNRDI